MQALLYLRELLQRKNADADVLSGCGHAINLGGFREFVHGHDLSKTVRIGATVSVDHDGLPEYVVAEEEMPELPRAYGSLTKVVETAGVVVDVEFSPLSGPYIKAYHVLINGGRAGTISAKPGQDPVVSLPEVGCLYEELFFPEDEEDDPPARPPWPAADQLDDGISADLASEPDDIGIEPEDIHQASFAGLTVVPDLGRAFGSLQSCSFKDETGRSDAQLREIFSQVFVGVGDLVFAELSKLRYIGPIRKTPSRSFHPLRSRDPSRWADGSAAWDLLYGANQELPWLDVRAINNLGLGYRLETSRKFEVPAEGVLGKALQRATLGLADAFEDLDRVPDEELRRIKERVHFELISDETHVKVQPADVGIGVSQVMPVVVGAMAPGCRVFAVEQPELHLHPKVQCNLADILIASIHANPDLLQLLETHSEHMMLRLMRRIRETATNQQPSEKLTLHPDQVQVLFVEIHEGRSIFRPMPLNERGEWVKTWPGGFFEEELEELF